MFEEYNICPYTGLRSFTEEESIYFKGRDEHIQQATEQLERNKFLMLTGASGDGKSSLVFAGIIPNARAGFLKAKYSNWTIANFRPERSPFKNLCQALAGALGVANVGTVESELQHGFSALVDLYKSSRKFTDKNSTEWLEADEQKRADLNRESANLIILADQFEEFFTNPENYIRGVPSTQAGLTLNLLLETAKIALREDLPIYIVFTMRSDYIGQCAAFRGLPEYIGFSQFFVPRLNRKQLQEVIEEPAVLAGLQISRRLVERLIHDVTEGTDQLPILQHALNQIWKAAGDGQEELDLIHYAMVGGLAPGELPDDQKDRFDDWLNTLSPEIQACFKHQSLQNVLDTHANILYFSASDYLKQKTGATLPLKDVQEIIRVTFTSLTKIDHSRAVRNRMTLQEITDIIDRRELNIRKVAAVIDLFREPGNTFIHPFISEEEGDENHDLAPATVLDITHESLIRNWQMLRDWAEEEYDKFVVFADLKQQVDRWLASDRNWGFLLPIGSMVFFERWFKEKKVNAHWINRYNEQVTETAKDLGESRQILDETESFLGLSKRRHAISLAVMHLGARRLIISIVLLAVLILSSFTVYDQVTRKNFYVLDNVYKEAETLINGTTSPGYIKGSFLILAERNEAGKAQEILDVLESDIRRMEAATAIGQLISRNDPRNQLEMSTWAIIYADNVAARIDGNENGYEGEPAEYFTILNELVDAARFANHYNPDERLQKVVNDNARRLGLRVLAFLRGHYKIENIKGINEAIHIALAHRVLNDQEIAEILSYLSPFEGADNSFTRELWSRDKLLATGSQRLMSFNGLYLNLAGLYASLGEIGPLTRAMDTIYQYHADFEEWATDGNTVGGYLAINAKWEELKIYARYQAERNGLETYQVYRRMLDRAARMQLPIAERMAYLQNSPDINDAMVLEFMPYEVIDRLFNEMKLQILEVDDRNERNFMLAHMYKQKGLLSAKQSEDQLTEIPTDSIYSLFDRAMGHYRRIDKSYLDQEVSTFFRLEQVTSMRNMFIYPDQREFYQWAEPRSRYARYQSPSFMNYVMDREHMDELYTNIQELELLPIWVNEYKSSTEPLSSEWWFGGTKVKGEFWMRLSEKLNQNILAEDLNLNLLKIIVANAYFEEGDTKRAGEVVETMDLEAVWELLSEEWDPNNVRTFHLIAVLQRHLRLNNMDELASRLTRSVDETKNTIRFLGFTAIRYFQMGQDSLGDQLYDSMKVLRQTVTNEGNPNWNYKKTMAYVEAMQGKEGSVARAKEYLSPLNPVMINDIGYRLIVRSMSFNEKFYDALTAIPEYASSEEKMMAYTEILYGQVYFEEDADWSDFDYFYSYLIELITFDRPNV